MPGRLLDVLLVFVMLPKFGSHWNWMRLLREGGVSIKRPGDLPEEQRRRGQRRMGRSTCGMGRRQGNVLLGAKEECVSLQTVVIFGKCCSEVE